MTEILYKVIDSKVIDYAEVVLCLFEHCNLNCVFCPQDHESVVGASRQEIIQKANGAVKWMNDNSRSKYFKLHIMGGELFEDRFIEDGFLEIYSDLIEYVNEHLTPDKVAAFNFVTNLVFEDTQPVLDFLKKYGLKVSISYDPSGRFTPAQKEIFKRNVEIFKPHIEMVSLVLTEQNMKAVMAGDETYNDLYENFTCDWDNYIPTNEKIAPHLMPSESLMVEFYKWLVDNNPECLNIRPFTHPEPHNKMRCTRGNNYTVLADNSKPHGCSGSVLLKDAMTERNESSVILDNFFSQHHCFECEYFSRCPFTCFITNDYKNTVRDINGCVFKETFKYVEAKENV